jgi:cupin fold WbuC family metalloprotein
VRKSLFFFDDDGNVTSAVVLGGSSRLGVDIPAGVWHTLVALTPFAVVFEVKAGPYLAAQGKDFPAWAPRDGDPEVSGYLERLLAHLPPDA